jgi:hypothetical protein
MSSFSVLNGGGNREREQAQSKFEGVTPPQSERLSKRTVKMMELHRDLIKQLQRNAFELMAMLADLEEIDGVVNKDNPMTANTQEVRYSIIEAAHAQETVFTGLAGGLWQQLADRLRAIKKQQ